MSEVVINNDNFKSEVLESSIPVLVDFWATWCGPCRMIAPNVSKIAENFEGKIKVCKADVDQVPELAQSFGVSSIPTIMLFKNGEAVDTHIGATTYGFLEAMVKQVL